MIWRFQIYNFFAKYLNFEKRKAIMYFAKFVNAFVKPRNFKFFRTSKNGLNSAYFAKIAHKIAKPKYFPNIFDDSDSPINSLSDDI